MSSVEDLKAVLEKMAVTTNVHSFEDCHDMLEAQRDLGDIISRADDATKKALIKQWEKIPSVWVQQQMAGYNLLRIIESGEYPTAGYAAVHLDEMITACNEIMK